LSANLFPSKKLTPQQVGLLSAAVPSPFGDALGLLADGMGYAQNPETLTPMSGLLSLAGMIPGIPGKASRKELQAIAKRLGLPATGKTDEIAELVGIAQKNPHSWSRGEYDKIKEYLSVHQDVRPDSASRVGSIMERGLDSGMVDSVGNMEAGRWAWAKGPLGGDAYLFTSGGLKYQPQKNAWLAPGNKPLAHVATQPGDTSFYDALVRPKR
jgi:hypothetical protein